jgi:hypothetical protein
MTIRSKVKKLAKQWIFRTGLGFWHINLHLHKKYKFPGEVHTYFEYFEADIHFGLNHLKNMTRLELEMVIIHELAHILTAEMNRKKIKVAEIEAARIAGERVASQVAKALYWAHYNA